MWTDYVFLQIFAYFDRGFTYFLFNEFMINYAMSNRDYYIGEVKDFFLLRLIIAIKRIPDLLRALLKQLNFVSFISIPFNS